MQIRRFMAPKKKSNSRPVVSVPVSSSPPTTVQRRELPPKPVHKPLPVVSKDHVRKSDRSDGDAEEAPKEKPARGPRKKPTIEGHIEKYEQVLALLDAEIDRKSREKEKGARAFRKARKLIIQMRKELPAVTRSKAARMQSSLRKNTTSGIAIQYQISEELADFLQVPHGTRLSRIEATRGICAYAHWKDDEKREDMLRWKHLNPNGKRNLQNPQDKKVVIPDKLLVKLLRYNEYKKDVKTGKVYKKVKDKESGKENLVQMTSDLLYYWVIQKLISHCFLKDEEGNDEPEEELEELDEDEEEEQEDEDEQDDE